MTMPTYQLLADKKVVPSERPLVDRDDGIALANVHLAEHPKTKEIVVSGDDGSIWKRTQTTGWKQEKKGESSVWPKVGAAIGVGAIGFTLYKLFFETPEKPVETAPEPPLLAAGTKVLGVFDSEAARDAFATAAHAAGASFLGIAVPDMARGVDLDAATPYIESFDPDLVLLGLTRQAGNGNTFLEAATAKGKVINVYTRGMPPRTESQNLTNLRNASKPFYGVAPESPFANLSGFAKESFAILRSDNPSQNERIL